ncbi:FAD-dependent oxidoreductase [Algivirga pacifica]|uniref:FAD dependent oxidoreductase n=1 Tax=Algivirga pacifica TaxID=1162670 RepID=A0ABP9D3H8_9BACT
MHDYIIYNASIAGVAFAIEKKRAGASVLLLNHYGFCGGVITESLALQQKTNGLEGIVKELFEAIQKEHRALFGQAEDEVILNPEVVKSVLLYQLMEAGVECLFHVHPKEIKEEQDGITLQLVAKEGLIERKAKRVIDASFEQHIGHLYHGQKRTLQSVVLNLMTTVPQKERFLTWAPIDKAIKTADGRYFLTLVPEKGTGYNALIGNALTDHLTIHLQADGARIQLLPTQALLSYQEAPQMKGEVQCVPTYAANEAFKTANEFLKSLIALEV